jgi:DNA-binding CsgD family transcriptional regulator
MSFNNRRVIYHHYLAEIKGVSFSLREIDIIACILHNRGGKKIASLLSISPKTVNAHIYNITIKIGCSSREYVIDFFEKSGRLQHLRQYYIYLLLDSSFVKCLYRISKLHNITSIVYTITTSEQQESPLIKLLTTHLKCANINVSLDRTGSTSKFNTYNMSYPELNQDDIGSYYFFVLEFFQKIINTSEILGIVQEFKEEVDALKHSIKEVTASELLPSIEFQNPEDPKNVSWKPHRIVLILCMSIIFLTSVSTLIFFSNFLPKKVSISITPTQMSYKFLNMRDSSGDTPLLKAVKDRNITLVASFLDSEEVDPNVIDEYGDTALHKATKDDNYEAVKLILKNPRVNPNIKDKWGDTALHWAVKSYRLGLCRELASDKRFNWDIVDEYGDTVLKCAIDRDNEEIIELCLAITGK